MNKINLIWTKEHVLEEDFCRKLIQKFEGNPNEQNDGSTIIGVQKEIKKTKDLKIVGSDWPLEDLTLYKKLTESVDEYKNYLSSIGIDFAFQSGRELHDTGYQIQKYETFENDDENGFYDWHHDFVVSSDGVRILTFIWYLNDVAVGGETEFIDGTKIVPKTGRILIFPASWDMRHRGCKPLSNEKYIVTGWIYLK